MSSFTIFHSLVRYILTYHNYSILCLCHYCTIQFGTFIATITRIFSECLFQGFQDFLYLLLIQLRGVRDYRQSVNKSSVEINVVLVAMKNCISCLKNAIVVGLWIM